MHELATFGKSGEDLAAAHLAAKGYDVVERNVRTPVGELDLVCRKGKEIVFVEVKSRRDRTYGHPEEAITRAKQRHLVQAAQWALADRPALARAPWRIDVVTVAFRGDAAPEIRHLENAVGTTW